MHNVVNCVTNLVTTNAGPTGVSRDIVRHDSLATRTVHTPEPVQFHPARIIQPAVFPEFRIPSTRMAQGRPVNVSEVNFCLGPSINSTSTTTVSRRNSRNFLKSNSIIFRLANAACEWTPGMGQEPKNRHTYGPLLTDLITGMTSSCMSAFR